MASETIGHYATNAKARHGTTLKECTTGNILDIVRSTGVCPYEHGTRDYKEWKCSNLPIVFFTRSKTRPSKAQHTSTEFAAIDIDDVSQKITSNHQSVFLTQYTPNGVHFIVHSKHFKESPEKWLKTYKKLEYEILLDIGNNIKADFHSANPTQGLFLWNVETVINNNYNPEYEATSETIALKEETLNGSVVDDFKKLHYSEFLSKYKDRYGIITGSEKKFDILYDYNGVGYEMCKNNGNIYTVFRPFSKNYLVPIGKRRQSLVRHLFQTIPVIMGDNGSVDSEHILFDSVEWVFNHCESGWKFDKDELLYTVKDVVDRFEKGIYKPTPYVDKRTFITGREMIDDNGVVTTMDKSQKIKANAKIRKTQRMVSMLEQWDLTSDTGTNVKRWAEASGQTIQTVKGHLRQCMESETIFNDFPWLKDLNIVSTNKTSSKGITIFDKLKGKTICFNSHKELMKYLGKSSRDWFNKFSQGKSKLNNRYEIVKTETPKTL